jgi:hypothetical protein
MTTYLHLYNIKQNFSKKETCSSDKTVENIKTQLMFSNIFIDRVVYEIMRKNYGTVRQATQDIIWRMRFACCMTTAKDTQSEYVILIAFLWQKLLRERVSMLRCRCTVCLVKL